MSPPLINLNEKSDCLRSQRAVCRKKDDKIRHKIDPIANQPLTLTEWGIGK